jgi:uncharacterized protein
MYFHEDQTYKTRPRLMSDLTFDMILRRVREYCDAHSPHRMYLHLHGGEPTLVKQKRIARFASAARDVLGDSLAGISMQTNATLIDDRWIEVLREQRIRVGVSLDGPSEIHDIYRMDHASRGSHAATVRGLKRLQDGGINPAVLCVINFNTRGLDIFRYLRSLHIKKINFLLPDVSHDSKNKLYGTYGDTPVADYLIPVFDEWFIQDDSEVRIPLFWHLLRTLMGGTPIGDVFGNPLMSYLIVESDGSIQTLDALKVCKEGISDSGLNVFEHGFGELHLGMPLVHQLVHIGIPLPTRCETCNEKSWCGGGYLPHRYAKSNGFDNPSVWCADILKLLGHIRYKVSEVDKDVVLRKA